MSESIYNQLQIREIFHLEFLKWLGRKVKSDNYAIKGGVNLRFFFNSFRYSEDMDLDVSKTGVSILKDIVMKILAAESFKENLKPFGIVGIIPPDICKAKQTETTQRFKIHLITLSGENLFTKVEFSRRGFKGEVITQPVSDNILRAYKMPPLLVAHYDINSAITQKIEALATRAAIQARDIFDLYILSPQYETQEKKWASPHFSKAKDNVFAINFKQFRDTVVSYLSPEDQAVYNKPDIWDEIRLKVSAFIELFERKNG